VIGENPLLVIYATEGRKEFLRYLNIAAGSASELDTQLEILLRIEMSDKREIYSIKGKLDEIAKMIQGLIKTLR
jgi:four helix bundle protein